MPSQHGSSRTTSPPGPNAVGSDSVVLPRNRGMRPTYQSLSPTRRSSASVRAHDGSAAPTGQPGTGASPASGPASGASTIIGPDAST